MHKEGRVGALCELGADIDRCTTALTEPSRLVRLSQSDRSRSRDRPDDGPSGIATYSQAGAQFQYGLLWTSLLTLPLMAGVQEICDRTALATGKGLGELAYRRFPNVRIVLAVLISALLAANMLNVADSTISAAVRPGHVDAASS